MLKFGSNNIGKIYLGSNLIGKAYLGSNLVYTAGGQPTPPPPGPSTETITMSSADLFAGQNCGGFINVNDNKFKTSSTYNGVIIDITGLGGSTISFERAAAASQIRYAYLTNATVTNNTVPSFSTETGYTTQINNTEDTSFSETIPSDACYLYVYAYSSGTNVAPSITITGVLEHKNVDLEASLFATNTTIGTDGQVYTGSSAPTVICTGYLSVHEYSFLQQIEFIVNSYPSGVDTYRVNVAEYTTSQAFIRRDSYTDAPYTQTLKPETAFVRIMVCCKLNGTELSGDVVRFDGNMLQVKAIDTV